MMRLLVLVILAALLAACAPAGVIQTTPTVSVDLTRVVTTSPDTPTDNSQPGTTNPYQPLESDAQLKRGIIFIDSSQILVLESYPLQFRLEIKGSLPTPCHQLRLSVGQPDASNRVEVDAYSVYNPDAVCVQVLKPFDALLSLDGLTAGKYSIWLNGALVGEIEVPAPLEGQSMKGWEIYSWQVDGAWYYALLPGTNRFKTLEEVQDPAVRLDSLEALKSKLAGLARGEWVTWLVLDYGGLELPPNTVLEQVQMWADLHGLNLQTAVR